MRKLSCFAVIVVLAVCAGSCSGGLPAIKGSDWLASMGTEPPGMNISGNWNSEDWRLVIIRQEGAVLSGSGDYWPMKGIVSGKKAYMAFFSSDNKKLFYTAELKPSGEKELTGYYSKYDFVTDPSAGKLPMIISGCEIKVPTDN